jgi:prepilin-type N-terminal cleavage/methylation domain-containing protein
MFLRAKSAQKGFTLIELLIVIAIIGLIAAMLIPNLLDALQKVKQKRTMADMRITGTAMFSWLSDQVGAAAAGASSTNIDLGSYGAVKQASDLSSILVPAYLQVVPPLDGWKAPFDYYINLTDLVGRHVLAIRSKGRDFVASGTAYSVSNFEPTDYDQDVVWADGFMVRWPQK